MAAVRSQPVTRSDPRLAHLLVNLAALLWASNILLGRALHDQIGPLTLTAFRFLVAGTLFSALLARSSQTGGQARRARLSGQDWFALAGMGFTGIFAFPALLYLALQKTTATNTALINGTGPLMTALLAGVFLREGLPPARLAGTLVSLAGVVIVISGGSLQNLQSLRINPGDLIALVDVFLWGFYSILTRIATRTRPVLEATAISTGLALPLLVAASLLEWRGFTSVFSRHFWPFSPGTKASSGLDRPRQWLFTTCSPSTVLLSARCSCVRSPAGAIFWGVHS